MTPFATLRAALTQATNEPDDAPPGRASVKPARGRHVTSGDALSAWPMRPRLLGYEPPLHLGVTA